MSIGENIKKLREEKELTQEQLARQIGVSQAMLAQIERGTKSCAMQLGKLIAQELECSVLALYGEEESNVKTNVNS